MRNIDVYISNNSNISNIYLLVDVTCFSNLPAVIFAKNIALHSDVPQNVGKIFCKMSGQIFFSHKILFFQTILFVFLKQYNAFTRVN